MPEPIMKRQLHLTTTPLHVTTTSTTLLLLLLFLSTLITTTTSFVLPSTTTFRTTLPPFSKNVHPKSTTTTTTLSMTNQNSNSITVISPPGGIGEISAVSAAKRGANVKWFVLSPSSSSQKIMLSTETLSSITQSGGTLELAGEDVASFRRDPSKSGLSNWCGTFDGLICTTDFSEDEEEEERMGMEIAVKLATREVSKGCRGVKVVVLSVSDDDDDDDGDGEEKKGGGGLLGLSFLKSKVDGPSNWREAVVGGENGEDVVMLRHGELFGIPDSSRDAAPFLNGPRRDPILRDEYTLRSIRLDPTSSVTSTTISRQTRTSRLSLGEAASRIALQSVPTTTTTSMDICLASLRGSYPLEDREWTTEFQRVVDAIGDGSSTTTTPQLFEVEFESIPNPPKLADWLATKWAPTILRTYDLAGIRVGARPVYASRVGDTGVEIVWQKLVDFESTVVGKMVIDISNEKLVAVRAGGDAAKGFGEVAKKPLAGEEILVRSLADAANQAVEKGLAKKKKTTTSKPKKQEKQQPVPVTPSASAGSSTVVSSGNVVPQTADNETPTAAAAPAETGPRSAGARRSSERRRGKRRTTTTTQKDDTKTTGEDTKKKQSESDESWQ